MRKFRLMLTDPRLRAVLGALKATAPALGDLAGDPGAAADFFRPLRASLRRAASAAPAASPASPQALAAAEDLLARLEKLFADLALHGTAPDPAVKEALLYLQRACGEAGALLSPGGRAGALATIRGFSAGARKGLALARAAADRAPGGFPQNLKFSSIYSGLDAVFDACELCAGSLFRI